jgi:UDP-galactopyranose mutase
MATMARDNQNIVILGAGITGLTAAWKLSETYPGSVVLLEKEPAAGGLAATFRREDFSFDIGSHRLHEGYDPAVAQLIHEICGDELLRRERRGLILVKNRSLRYPPSPLDILFAFGAGDLFRFTRDFIAARLAAALSSGEPDNFEDFTIRSVGKSLYERFYKPYAFKLYKLPPHKISKEPALSRVRKFAISAIFQDLIKKLTKAQSSFYYYPARGIGHLSEALQQRFLANRGKMILLSNIEKIQLNDKR